MIIKNYEATNSNPNFAGDRQKWMCGKRDYCVEFNKNYVKAFAKEHGFSTKAALAKALKKEQELVDFENSYGYWKISLSTIEVNC